MSLPIGIGLALMILECMAVFILETTMHMTVGAGDIKFSFANALSFTLNNVHHVSKLTKSLISTGQLNKVVIRPSLDFKIGRFKRAL